ncbi:hypothetical protein ACH5RR_029128 [Cinchona calisaya]|uniref:Uncharacterized protein n=1 Tax=Cinchona calisaya TaxID=153742 RepID=A0ABD2YQS2_9GENT
MAQSSGGCISGSKGKNNKEDEAVDLELKHQTYQGSRHEEHRAQGDHIQQNVCQAVEGVGIGHRAEGVGHGDGDEIDATFDYILQ